MYSFALLAVVALFALLPKQWQVFAPELFGGGKLYYVQVGTKLYGYSPAWGHWLFYGERNEQTMNCWLKRITSDGPQDADTVACFGRFTDDKFRGWIDYRGHLRKFCGAVPPLDLPRQCFGE